LTITHVLADAEPPSGFVRPRGTEFVLDDDPFYFAGTNCYWASFLTNITDVSVTFDRVKAAGLKVIRTHIFNEKNETYNPNGLPQYGSEHDDIVYQWWSSGVPAVNTGPTGLAHFDRVVKLAEERNLKLILTLTNNWADFGGMDVYNVNFGEQYHDAFYTSPKVIAAFKTYVEAVVTRYKHSPAILAWETANEPRCGGEPKRNLPRSSRCTTKTITTWAAELSEFIKSLDKWHMVSLGDEGMFNNIGTTDGFYNGTDGIDFDQNLQIKTLDFGTFHLYPYSWNKTIKWGVQYVKDHATSAMKFNKPVVFEEYGWPFEITRVQAVSAWQEESVKKRLAGDLFWQLGIKDLSSGESPSDATTIYLGDADAKPLVYDHARAVDLLN